MTADGNAVRASFRRDNADLSSETVSVRFPASGDHPEARVDAVAGRGNLKARQFTATGGVRAQQGGQTATTEEARYSAADGLVRGDRPIEVRSGRLTVLGPGFTLDPSEQVLHIEGGARAVAGAER